MLCSHTFQFTHSAIVYFNFVTPPEKNFFAFVLSQTKTDKQLFSKHTINFHFHSHPFHHT